jgi:hypothetical protein
MISSFFPSGLARWMSAKPEGKKEAGWGGVLPGMARLMALPVKKSPPISVPQNLVFGVWFLVFRVRCLVFQFGPRLLPSIL